MKEEYKTTNIVGFIKKGIVEDRIEPIHKKIVEINGVGSKIASFFIRDVSIYNGIFPDKDKRNRDLLQPIDTWLMRAFNFIDQNILKSVKLASKWVIDSADEIGAHPELLNAGIWYFGSQISKSEYELEKACEDIMYAEEIVEEHIKSIENQLMALKSQFR